MLMLAKSIGRVNYLSADHTRELLDLKSKWGFTDPRNEEEMQDCDLCGNDVFRDSWQVAGVQRNAFEAPPAAIGRNNSQVGRSESMSQTGGVDQEQLVEMITDKVMAAMKGK
jgi:L-fuculose-phosphate aldolase